MDAVRTTRVAVSRGEKVMGNGSALAGFLLLFGAMSASPTSAQVPSVAGAYERMTPGNQKVARALFDAQAAAFTPVPPASGARTSRMLTLDEIAAQKQSSQGWGQVFQAMRSQGLVQETSLGQVVTRYESQRSRAAAAAASRGRVATRTPQEAAQR
jgi:hypothetical protein